MWNDIETLVIDEVSMLSAQLLDKIEHVARIVRRNDKPFGGIQIILSGDFLQLPTIEGNFCFNATCWEKLNLRYFVLTTIRRQVDVKFQTVLNAARVGSITDSDVEYLLSGGEDAKKTMDNGIVPTRILCKNIDVDVINEQELAKLPATETFTYEMEIEMKQEFSFKPEFFCPTPKRLTVSIGAQIMLLVNKYQDSGLVNGSRGVVVDFDKEYGTPIVKFANGVQMNIGFHAWEIVDKKKIYGYIHAIPLKLAWAVTCHKAQGLSIDSAIIDLNGVFEFGQAYVAVSRVRSHSALILKSAERRMFKAHPSALKFYEELM